jgi:hypothetical protein
MSGLYQADAIFHEEMQLATNIVLDPDQLDWRMNHAWYVIDQGYACRNIHGVWYPIHVWVLEIEAGHITQWKVTHVDGNKMNNKRDNLRKEKAVGLKMKRLRVWALLEKGRLRVAARTSEGKLVRQPIEGQRYQEAMWVALSKLILYHLPDQKDACGNVFTA